MNRYRKIRLDELLWALGGFAEPEPTAVELRDRHLARMWRDGLTCSEIAAELGMRVGNVTMRRYVLGLPKRRAGRPKAAA